MMSNLIAIWSEALWKIEASDETSLKVETVERTLQIDHEKKILAYVREHGSIKNASCQELLELEQSAPTEFLIF